ncbi:MAG TPA: dNTP triphosphohydrolase [Acidobacteriaceae bacterium]|jgi:dGTPase|nr:dNTP triphosphohydrolase [Acidobacteriaceae bacterium]
MPNVPYATYDEERRYHHGSTAVKRDEFEVDKARIIYSGAFRRLQGKTQVLGVGERDFYRTRLTHSLEVAQIARGLCTELPSSFQPNRDLVETICLAHDIGHSPFGHSGEGVLHKELNTHIARKIKLNVTGERDKDEIAFAALPDVDKDLCQEGGFGANPQNLRVVALLEAKYDTGGLDLTRAALDGLIKYPKAFNWCSHNKPKSYYLSDQDLVDWVKKDVHDKSRTPIEGQLADWADQMAYSINDIEDVVRAGLLSFTEMRGRSEEISDAATNEFRSAREKRRESDGGDPPPFLTAEKIEQLAQEWEEQFLSRKSIRVRKLNLKQWTSDTVKSLKKGCEIVDLKNNEFSVRYKHGLKIPADAEGLSVLLKTIAFNLVFSDPRVKTLEAKGAKVIRELFEVFVQDTKLLPLDWQEMIQAKKYGSKERLICDFIAGMTDKYAYAYYSRLTLPGAGSFYEFV